MRIIMRGASAGGGGPRGELKRNGANARRVGRIGRVVRAVVEALEPRRLLSSAGPLANFNWASVNPQLLTLTIAAMRNDPRSAALFLADLARYNVAPPPGYEQGQPLLSPSIKTARGRRELPGRPRPAVSDDPKRGARGVTQTLTKGMAMRVRLSVPGSGSTVSAATECRAAAVREAVAIVHRAFQQCPELPHLYSLLLGSRWRFGTLANGTEPSALAAWGLVAIRMVGRLAGALDRDASLHEAESWFIGGIELAPSLSALVVDVSDRLAVGKLEEVAYDDDLRDLLPYVLDGYGPGSRASVMRNPETQTARAAKRAGGVFYTPADVAEYIAGEAISLHGGEPDGLRFLDPASGSGVFLRAVLGRVSECTPKLDRFAFAEQCLFGIDIDPLAVNAACFVLLHDCLRGETSSSQAPWSMWHRLRCNLVVADALTLGCERATGSLVRDRTELRSEVGRRFIPPATQTVPERERRALFVGGHSLGDVFPELTEGADVVLGNPPYAAIGRRDDAASLDQRFASFAENRGSEGLDFFPLFIEMMWRLTRPGKSAAGMVVPLSLAYHGGSQMSACRRAIVSSGGRWRFAFFDREPHALFGEDVKTRNAIALREESESEPRRGEPASVETGRLRKWTSRMRARLFESIDFTPLEDSRIEEGIPRLAGRDESHAFAVLERSASRFHAMWVRSGRCLPGDVCENSDVPRVFVANTAYNFLNVFRPHRKLPPAKAAWSENPLHALEFADEVAASKAFAILGSRVTYWLWHVLEDGFHVSRGFLENVPFGDGSFDESLQARLSELGTELWDAVQTQQIVSVNAGRQSVAYRPHACEGLRDQIDRVLLEAAGIDPNFVDRLREFVRSAVTVDEKDDRRRRFVDQFNGSEGRP